jgi:hypothetical protein
MTLDNPDSEDDMVLDLFNEAGLLKHADDPETITMKLAPGRYWVVASLNSPSFNSNPFNSTSFNSNSRPLGQAQQTYSNLVLTIR